MENVRVVFVSIPRDEARAMARKLVEERLAACANIIPQIESFFWWEEKVQEDKESLIILKTSQSQVERLITYVRDNHPYDVPEVITLPLAEGLPDYIDWVIEECGKR
jgi:periplasmic divalent cation tolerance protein